MNTDCLEHTLTEQERIRFERDGYFVLDQSVEDCSTGASRSAGSCWVISKNGGMSARRRRKRTCP